MEQFGPYVLEEVVGRGGMGEVYRAFDTVRERTVALKVLPAHLAADQMFQTRFRRESRVAARLNEPHIIPIHDFGEIDGRLYIDMRLVEGRDLSTVLAQDGALRPPTAVNLTAQVASALDAAHRNGLVHRDVKPSNILVAMDGDVSSDAFAYLVDFGIARIMPGFDGTSVTSTAAAVGTLAYMAPERIDGRSADARSDVYSLACVLYELLTGRKPFDGEMVSVMYAHLNSPRPRPSDVAPSVSDALDSVVARGMAISPDDRYPTAGELGRAARTALARSPVLPFMPPPPRPSVGALAASAPAPARPEPMAPEAVAAEPMAPEPMAPEPMALRHTAPEPSAPEFGRSPGPGVAAGSAPQRTPVGPQGLPPGHPSAPLFPEWEQTLRRPSEVGRSEPPRGPMVVPAPPPPGSRLPGPPQYTPPPRRSRRWLLVTALVVALVVAAAAVVYLLTRPSTSHASPPGPTTSVAAVPGRFTDFAAFSDLVGSRPGDTAHAYLGATCGLVAPSTRITGMTEQVSCLTPAGTSTYTVSLFATGADVSSYVGQLTGAAGYVADGWTIDSTRRGYLYTSPAGRTADITTTVCADPTALVQFFSPDTTRLSAKTLMAEWTASSFPDGDPAHC